MSLLIESLESRTLLSVVPHKSDSVTITEDKAAILSTKEQIKIDTAAAKAKLVQDKAAITVARATEKAAVAADRVQIKLHKGNPDLIAADRAAIVAAKAQLVSSIAAAKAQIAQDKAAEKLTIANDKLTLKAEEAKLKADRKAHL